VHYIKGRRSLEVMQRTPDLKLLQWYDSKFSKTKVFSFGSITYLILALISVFPEDFVVKISNFFDKTFSVKRSAFKFVSIAEK